MIAFVILAVAISIGLQLNANASTAKLRKAQHVACVKANILVRESNQRIRSHLVLRDATEDSLVAAATARRASYKVSHHASDLRAAKRSEELITRIRRDVKYHTTPLIPCT